MGYVDTSKGTAVTRFQPRMVSTPSLGSVASISSAVGGISNPISAVTGLIGSIFGGSDRSQKVPQHKAMIQQMYNNAVQGDVVNAQKLLWCITGDYDENKPFASALWQQLATSAPKVYQAALQAGPYPQPKGVDITVSPLVANASLTGTASSSSIGGALSSITGGAVSSSLALPLLAIGALYFLKK